MENLELIEFQVLSGAYPFSLTASSASSGFSFPPPSTVWGMLKSTIGKGFDGEPYGEQIYEGNQLATAFFQRPLTGHQWRKARKNNKNGAAAPQMQRQKKLYHIHGVAAVQGPMAQPLQRALQKPLLVHGRGALSLGESEDVVSTLKVLESPPTQRMFFLVPQRKGPIQLSVLTPKRPDKRGKKEYARDTEFARFRLVRESDPALWHQCLVEMELQHD